MDCLYKAVYIHTIGCALNMVSITVTLANHAHACGVGECGILSPEAARVKVQKAAVG